MAYCWSFFHLWPIVGCALIGMGIFCSEVFGASIRYVLYVVP